MEICEEIIPGLSEETIAQYSGSTIYDRGLDYYEHGAVSEVVKSNNLLVALVEGNEYDPYEVKITFDKGGIKKSSCNCRYDGYNCKHIVAVLLYCLNSPDEVEKMGSLTKELKKLNKYNLVKIVETLIETDISIARKVLMEVDSLSNHSTKRTNLIDPDPYRKEAMQILRSTRHMSSSEAYYYEDELIGELGEIVNKAKKFSDDGDGKNAIVILNALTEVYINEWTELDGSSDESGEFFTELDDAWCEAVLTAELLEDESSVLLDKISSWEGEICDYGIDDGFDKTKAALEEGWDDENLKLVLSGKESLYEVDLGLAKKRLKILAYQNRFEEYLNFARYAELTSDYVCMLIQQERVEEAMNIAKSELCDAGETFEVAKKLRDYGHTEHAVEIATKGLELDGNKSELGDWLSCLAESLGNKGLAKTSLLHAFKESISLERYKRLLKLTPPEELDKTKEELLNITRKGSDFYLNERVDIFLSEDLFDDAIAAADRKSSYVRDPILKKVMGAVFSYKPDWVIKRGEEKAMDIIDQGQAKYYDEAVIWLKFVHEAYKAEGKAKEWESCLGSIQYKHGKKRKLMGLIQNAFM